MATSNVIPHRRVVPYFAQRWYLMEYYLLATSKAILSCGMPVPRDMPLPRGTPVPRATPVHRDMRVPGGMLLVLPRDTPVPRGALVPGSTPLSSRPPVTGDCYVGPRLSLAGGVCDLNPRVLLLYTPPSGQTGTGTSYCAGTHLSTPRRLHVHTRAGPQNSLFHTAPLWTYYVGIKLLLRCGAVGWKSIYWLDKHSPASQHG